MDITRELLDAAAARPLIATTPRGMVEYSLSGNGEQVILVLHGGMGGHDQARLMVAGWLDPSAYRFLCPSRPGYLGTPVESGTSMEAQADLFAALLDELGIGQVSVVCASAGAPAGYLFALRHPGLIRALVVIDGVSGYYELPAPVDSLLEDRFGKRDLVLAAPDTPEGFIEKMFANPCAYTPLKMKEQLAFALADDRARAYAGAFMKTMFPYEPRRPGTEQDMAMFVGYGRLKLEKIGCPSLIIHGTHDQDVRFYDGVYAYQCIPDADYCWIEDGLHMGFWLCSGASRAQQQAAAFLGRHCHTNTNNDAGRGCA